ILMPVRFTMNPGVRGFSSVRRMASRCFPAITHTYSPSRFRFMGSITPGREQLRLAWQRFLRSAVVMRWSDRREEFVFPISNVSRSVMVMYGSHRRQEFIFHVLSPEQVLRAISPVSLCRKLLPRRSCLACYLG
ncbi:MAG: hypothetical protein RIQ56_383, partial [Candidatus Parcubacteria bacterium]